jgi:heptosyltransferase III
VTFLKPLEVVAKLLLAAVSALLLWRPGRKARANALLAGAKKVLVVRIDNRVGEALITTPVFSALKLKPNPPKVYALVHQKCARVLEGHPHLDGVIALDRRMLALGAWAPGIRALRELGFDAVVNCASWSEASVTAALVARLAAPNAVLIGPDVFPSSWLCDVVVPPLPSVRSEQEQRRNIASPLGLAPGPARQSFRHPRGTPAIAAYLPRLRPPFAVLNPGGRLGFRRVPPSVFAGAARELMREGVQPLVVWGPGEEAMADEVVAAAPGALKAPPTNLDELAVLMQQSQLTVTNNTGPMHLSAALAVPTLTLFLKMEVARWGHDYPPHAIVDLTPYADQPGAMEQAAVEGIQRMLKSEA